MEMYIFTLWVKILLLPHIHIICYPNPIPSLPLTYSESHASHAFLSAAANVLMLFFFPVSQCDQQISPTWVVVRLCNIWISFGRLCVSNLTETTVCESGLILYVMNAASPDKARKTALMGGGGELCSLEPLRMIEEAPVGHCSCSSSWWNTCVVVKIRASNLHFVLSYFFTVTEIVMVSFAFFF